MIALLIVFMWVWFVVGCIIFIEAGFNNLKEICND